MTKQISSHAAAAKMIRQELKKHGIKAQVRASSASMTSSVDVYLTDELPATVREVEKYVNQFQYGHFDGMIDCYEMSNNRDDIPQVKFTFVHPEYSDEMKQAAWTWLRDEIRMAGTEELSAEYAEARDGSYDSGAGFTYVSQEVYRVLRGDFRICGGRDFWTDRKPRVRAA